ncbi:uncharacterized protein [Aegilops tauschii subsp. strangulata]|uniref:uncharacterized protein n=1 Tax=Aegilops tauschii subsp. strangulata TaxID=200361 RepID=UPI003CC84226
MVSDTPDQNPFAPVADSASAMDDIPVLTPRSSVDSAACGLNAAPLQHVAPPAPAAPAAPPPSFPSAILQTIDIRRHVPVVLDLLAGNHAQWRRHFDTVLGMFGLRAHVDAETVPRPDDPEWQMANHTVIHWLYATISPELLDAIMQPEDTALTVWTAVDGIFRDNHLARAVYVDAEYHALVQGDLTVMQYCTKLKSFTDQLRDLGQPVTETRQIFHLLRGLNRQFHAAIPHITSQVPLPSFLQVRSFLLLEEHRAEQSARLQSSHALVAARGVAPPSPAPSTDNNRGRGRGRRRGRGNGAAVQAPPAPSPAPRPPSVLAPAPGANSWTGLVQAWPVAWRAPGSGVLGPRPGMPPQQAMFAAPHQPALPPYGYGAAGAPGYGAPTGYGHPGAGPSSLPSPAWDMASLQAALHNATAGPSSSGTTPEWYLDSGAATHMSSSPGNLLSVRPHLSASQVIIGSGDCLPIMHVGTGSLIAGTSPLQLRNVLVCPSIIINLLSVRQLCHDNPVSVEFDLFGFSVKDLRTKVVILRCNSGGDLYPVGCASSSSSRWFAGSVTTDLWHQRLGHPGRASSAALPFEFCKTSPHTQFQLPILALQTDNGREFDNSTTRSDRCRVIHCARAALFNYGGAIATRRLSPRLTSRGNPAFHHSRGIGNERLPPCLASRGNPAFNHERGIGDGRLRAFPS